MSGNQRIMDDSLALSQWHPDLSEIQGTTYRRCGFKSSEGGLRLGKKFVVCITVGRVYTTGHSRAG